jgi:GntR family transcriptional regulator / MocR family aminotransferase
VLFPGLRLGYLVVPRGEARRYRAAADLVHPLPSSPIDQATVADFMAEGHFARHIKRMRLLYRDRRAALAEALRTAFGTRALIELEPGGMHLMMRFRRGESDGELARRARKAGLGVTALSQMAVESKVGPGLVLSFTNIPVDAAPREARRLHRALSEVRP